MMNEDDRKVLLGRVKEGKCTPILGAGVNYGILPLGGEIAREWTSEDGFPQRSSEDLAGVARFVAVKYGDAMYPKDRVLPRCCYERSLEPGREAPGDGEPG
jgi:hypothetical protein